MNIRAAPQNVIKNKETAKIDNLNIKKDNKITLDGKTEIDLDLLFEKQLQKLREINREYESYDNENNHNNNMINNNNMKYKKQNETSKILYNNDKKNKTIDIDNIDNNNIINKNKPLIRPFSNYSKNRNILPKISSPRICRNVNKEEDIELNNNLTIRNISSNRNDKTKKRPISSRTKSPLHKEYGKIPKYLQEMKMKAEILKDIQKKKKEEEKYPKGTRLLSEEERLFTLQKLEESKKELENLIEKLPITLNSLSSRNRQQKLYKELNEVEQAITTFSKKQVFVKIDS